MFICNPVAKHQPAGTVSGCVGLSLVVVSVCRWVAEWMAIGLPVTRQHLAGTGRQDSEWVCK